MPFITHSDEARSKRLTLDTLFKSDSNLSGINIKQAKFSPEGTQISYLKPNQNQTNQLELWISPRSDLDKKIRISSDMLSNKKEHLSEQERANRERKRITSRGILQYQWAPKDQFLIISYNGDLYKIYPDHPKHPENLTHSEEYELNASLSNSGRYLAFIRDRNLYYINLKTNHETAITLDGKNAISYGIAEFIAQEEMGRYKGFWFSKKDQYLVYTKVDETPVDYLSRPKISASGLQISQQYYPKSGRPNAKIDLYIYSLKDQTQTKINLGKNTDIYIPRVDFGSDDQLYVQRQNRDQTKLDILKVNLKNGQAKIIYTETSPYWINLTKDFRALKNGNFIWSTEQTPTHHRQINLYTPKGNILHSITKNHKGAVLSLVSIDEKKGLLYYQGYQNTPLENHLYVVSYLDKDQSPKQLTQKPGWWSTFKINLKTHTFIASYQNTDQPSQTGLYHLDTGKRLQWINQNKMDQTHPYFPYLSHHIQPEFGHIKSQNGDKLYYSIQKPLNFNPNHTYPVIVSVYGGPHVQTVKKTWGSLINQIYLKEGFILFKIDNRGSARRHKAFETILHKNLSEIEIKDQLSGIEYLKTLPYIDPNRIGVRGWSYGGYMTLMLMLRSNDRYAAGVSGAPVTDWTLYDTHYTERYMQTPEQNKKGYQSSSVLSYATQLNKPLLLIHGMADDNVFLDHTLKLIDIWQKNNIPFELMLYPGQTHKFNRQKKQHAEFQTLAFFKQRLKNNQK